MRSVLIQSFFTALLLVALAAPSWAQDHNLLGLPDVLPHDLEVELALSAAPKHIRSEASVYVLGPEGYEKAKTGSNPYTCLVQRDPRFKDFVSPVCFDPEGMATIGHLSMSRAKMRRAGMDEETIRTNVEKGFKDGTFRALEKSGIAYMLSPVQRITNPQSPTETFVYVPHLMFHAPHICNADIGVTPDVMMTPDTEQPYILSGLPFMPITGPHGLIVIPQGEKERAAIWEEHQELIQKMRRYIAL